MCVPGDRVLVPEAMNPERAISYAMQNRAPTYQLPCVLILDAINPGGGISYAMQNRVPSYAHSRGYRLPAKYHMIRKHT